MRKGLFTIDMVIGFIIFLMIIITSLYYITDLYRPEPTLKELENAGNKLAQLLESDIFWTVYSQPLQIRSYNTTTYQIDIAYYPETNTDLNSIIVVDKNNINMNSSFVDNRLIFTTNLIEGDNDYNIIYTKDTALNKLVYTTDLSNTSSTILNSDLNVSFTSTGINQITYNATEFLDGTGITFSTLNQPLTTKETSIATAIYGEGITTKIYRNLSKIIIDSNHTFSPTIYLKKSFSNYYNGTQNTITTSGLQFSSTINHLDIYATDGISILGNNLNLALYNNTYIEVRLTDVTSFELYLHNGDYTNSLIEANMYDTSPEILILVPKEIRGISQDALSIINQTSYADLKSSYSGTVDFNITLSNTSIGIYPPTDIDVFGMKYPISIVNRLSQINKTTMDILIWK